MLGATGEGKSTLISYLCRKNSGDIKTNFNGFKWKIEHSGDYLPEIGNRNISCTSIPDIFQSKDGLVFLDPPGFFDTNGVTNEILNAFCISKMFKVNNNVRMLILVDVASLKAGRGGQFVKAIKRIHALFPHEYRTITKSCMFVLTKVDSLEMI